MHSSTHPITIAGALAYDNISVTDQLLNSNTTPRLNLKLTSCENAFGGCAGNLFYTLNLLGSPPLLLSSLGARDAADYSTYLEAQNADLDGLLLLPGNTAHGTIITDPNGDQFTAFFPGAYIEPARWLDHLNTMARQIGQSTIFVQAPHPPELMRSTLLWIKENTQACIIWCPGQYVDTLHRGDVENMSGNADWIVGNAYEIDKMQKLVALEERAHIIRTNGQNDINLIFKSDTPLALPMTEPTHTAYSPATAYSSLTAYSIPVPHAEYVEDPTGCGDAFLATLSHGLVETGLCGRFNANVYGEQPHANSTNGQLLDQADVTALIELINRCIERAQLCLAHPGAQSQPGA